MSNQSPQSDTAADRIWTTKWYRIRPQTFEHYELFFEEDRIYAVYADESFKSFLLRRDGRQKEATQLGEKLRDAPAEDLLSNERSFVMSTTDVTRIGLRSGTFLFKPKLSISTEAKTHEFYHPSRSLDTASLCERLASYFADSIKIEEEDGPFSW